MSCFRNLISLLFPLFSVCRIYSESLTFTVSTPPLTDIIRCEDGNTECIINCNASSICSNKEIHCHSTSQLACTINLNAVNTSEDTIIYTHYSPSVYIHGNAANCGTSIKVYAHERGGTQLFIQTTQYKAFDHGYIYGPIGQYSILSIKCGEESCNNMRIYEDWSTTVRLEPTGLHAFDVTQVYNLFDSGGLGITRYDDNYNDVDMDYRASVYILDCIGGHVAKEAFFDFDYNGVNHGDWIIRSESGYLLSHSTIQATTDSRVNQSVPYTVKLYGSEWNSLRRLSLYVGVGAKVFFDVIAREGLYKSQIYAKSADVLSIYCHEGADCGELDIECPDNKLANSCNWICEYPAQCEWENANIETPTPDAYDCNGLYLSSEISAKVYCGYDQTTDYCHYNSTSYSCSSACDAECTFNNSIAPVSIGDELGSFCNDDAITFPVLILNSTFAEPTTAEPTVTTSSLQQTTADEHVETAAIKPNTSNTISTATETTSVGMEAPQSASWITLILVIGGIVILNVFICVIIGVIWTKYKKIKVGTAKANKNIAFDQDEEDKAVHAVVENTMTSLSASNVKKETITELTEATGYIYGERDHQVLERNEGEMNVMNTRGDRMKDIVDISTTPHHTTVDDNVLELEYWLRTEVKLPQYFSILKNNGYESMQLVTQITDIKELKQIGIESMVHQIRILTEIQTWTYDNAADEFVVEADDDNHNETIS